MDLAAVRVVLVETSHPGNIGAAARAMKTMGLTRLVLVRPGRFPCVEATARAAGADDLLARAEVVDSLAEGLAGAGLVLGTSARLRSGRWPVDTPREAAARAVAAGAAGEVALVFGREQSGLSNDEMALCHRLVHIQANPDYSSLNLAAAVQILAYELRVAAGGAAPPAAAGQRPGEAPATAEEMAHFFAHLEATLVDLGYIDPANPRQSMARLRRLFMRAAPRRNEVQMLRGILTRIGKRLAGAA